MAAPDRTTADGHTDIRADDWIARRAPAVTRPYLRIARADRPIGWWLLLWPCWWGVALASPGWPSLWLMLLFLVGAVVMRAAGCCWNDIADRDFDGRVERTRTRPIPAGDLTVVQAGLFMVLLALVGLAILSSFNRFAILVGIASLAPVVIYPFMKRVTWWPQFFLGIAFNWGALLGWAAVRGTLDWPALALYLGGIAWTLGYDTIYAHQDKEDDALVGLKSSARRLGAKTRPALWAFYGLAMAGFLAAGILAGLGWLFLVLGLLAGGQLAWQVWRLDFDDPADCLAKFQSSNVFGWSFLAAIVASQVAG
ncbi:MAG: 4-hydroxybenzoate octaprenyltransferase [Alphaproteobacteria bacterium]|jgi:4-hydroxybenzoate polyprenyltransferase|nr:4-hydroxybenzoate octaprenyltransferase [Alphaproteobacteria bacterium]